MIICCQMLPAISPSFQSPRCSVHAHLSDIGVPARRKDLSSVSLLPSTSHEGQTPAKLTSSVATIEVETTGLVMAGISSPRGPCES